MVAGKRNYNGARRAESARQTRRVIIEAAVELYLRDGFGRTTVDAVADAAGVSRKTVFRAVGGKVELLKLGIDWAAVGDDENLPLAKRPAVAHLAAQQDADTILAEWADLTAVIGSRLAGLSQVLAEAAGVDPAARDLRHQARAQRHAGATAFTAFLASRGLLRTGIGVTQAADIVWFYSDPAIYQQFVVERGWSHQAFVKWLTDTIMSQLRT
jgi:AcrR family transcriptional regulator